MISKTILFNRKPTISVTVLGLKKRSGIKPHHRFSAQLQNSKKSYGTIVSWPLLPPKISTIKRNPTMNLPLASKQKPLRFTKVVKMLKEGEWEKTKYPVILLHGLFGYGTKSVLLDQMKLRYWKGVQEDLHDCCKAPNLGPVASIAERAQNLHAYLEQHFAGKSVNLVAFSMGGLDARYLLSHIPKKSYSVKSLATVSTPHRGSSFMNYCRDVLGVGTITQFHQRKSDDQVLNSVEPDFYNSITGTTRQKYVLSLLKHLDAPAFANLTTEYLAAFNRVSRDDPSVYYSSYAASADLKVYAPLAFPKWIVDQREGENDGLVSINSARWGNFKGSVQCDHWDLVPSSTRLFTDPFKQRPFDTLAFYKTVVTHLAQKGF